MQDSFGRAAGRALLSTLILGLTTMAAAAPIRIEAGGTANFTDHNGAVWIADTGFVPGAGGIVDRGNIAIGNTLDPRIYQTERWGMTAFAYPVPNGAYQVNLHFAETYAGITGAGQRVFSVNVEGTAINNIDVFAQAGGARKALIKTANVNVTDGQLNLTFTASANNAEINGIEIIPSGPTPTATSTATPTNTPTPTNTVTPTNPPTPTSTATSTPTATSTVPATARIEAGGTASFTDHNGAVWIADTGFTGGSLVNRGNIAIANTLDPRIYQTEHYSMTAFAYPVPNGSYQVNLHFAETYPGVTGAGQRVFSANVEGIAISNIDVFAQAGGANKALIKSVCAIVADGQLNITFTASVNNAEINGIEIVPGAACPTPTATPTASETPTATATPTQGTNLPNAISPYLVGQNVWDNPSDTIWNISSQAGLKIIRIGGIEYDNNMPSTATLAGWVNHIKALGAEPMIQVSRFQSPQAAANIVNYFNVQTGNRVKFWNIGNEPHCKMTDQLGAATDVARFVKNIAPAMKAVDPTIQIFAPDECYYYQTYYESLLGGASDITGKDAAGRYYIDGVSWHRYTGGALATAGAADFLGLVQMTRARVDFANARQGRTGPNALQWGIGEFNASTGTGVCSFDNGQMFAQIFGYLMKYGGTYAESWSMFESGGTCQGWDGSFISGDMKPRSSFYHMQMVSKNFSGSYLDGTSNLNLVRAYGSIDTAANRIAVMLLNVDTSVTPRACTVRLNSTPIASGECRINIPAGVAVDVSQPIGGQTSMVLVFDLQGHLTKTITYSLAANWTGGFPPSVTTFP